MQCHVMSCNVIPCDVRLDPLLSLEELVMFCPIAELQETICRAILDCEDMQLILHSGEPCDCYGGSKRGRCCCRVSRTKIEMLVRRVQNVVKSPLTTAFATSACCYIHALTTAISLTITLTLRCTLRVWNGSTWSKGTAACS